MSNAPRTGADYLGNDPRTGSNQLPIKRPGEYTIEEMAIAMRSLEYDSPPMKPWDYFPGTPANHLVYFVGGETGPIKIGWTQNLRNRLPCIQNGSSVLLSVLATQRAPKSKERVWHKQFASSRTLNEWFERTPELMRVIASLQEQAK